MNGWVLSVGGFEAHWVFSANPELVWHQDLDNISTSKLGLGSLIWTVASMTTKENNSPKPL